MILGLQNVGLVGSLVAENKAIAPTIDIVSAVGTTVYWRVRNNDSSAGTVYSEVNDATPEYNSASLSANATQSEQQVVNPLTLPFIIYAYTVVSGKTNSDVTQYYYEEF